MMGIAALPLVAGLSAPVFAQVNGGSGGGIVGGGGGGFGTGGTGGSSAVNAGGIGTGGAGASVGGGGGGSGVGGGGGGLAASGGAGSGTIATLTNTGTITGGASQGTSSETGGGGAGIGGGGGGAQAVGTGGDAGFTITNNTITNSGSITGGNGGTGPIGLGGGDGGSGGAGIGRGGMGTNNGVVGGAGGAGLGNITILNSGIIQGGNGGSGNTGGNGGDGINGSGLTITNNGGTIASGVGGTGTTAGTAGNAITFTGGANSLTLNGGTLTGNVVVQSGTLRLFSTNPTAGSFGANTIGGNVSLTTGSTYTVNVNAAGQADKITVTGTATLGGTVSAMAASGTYARTTTYTILTATGGLGGTTFSGATSNYAFLTASLTYDTNDVFLTLTSGSNAFASGAQTANQRAVGMALDGAKVNATGDFATVINALSGLDTVQGPRALDAISGQPIANFGTANEQMSAAFLNTVGATLGSLHDGTGGGQRVAMAAGATDACDFSCDVDPSRFGAWISGVGGLGSVVGNASTSSFTYNFGGAAVGADYRIDPQLLVGVGVGYVTGTQWVNGFAGQGTSNAFSGSVYASWTPSALYVDVVAGYGYSINRMTRPVAIPGLAARVAQGQTGANQLLGQVETGFKLDMPTSSPTSITPFLRLQGSTTMQNGFTESGADSLNLVVAAQSTNSLRTTLGANFAAELAKVAFNVRMGWQHENADTSRPMTASFAGAPGNAFTVFGATPQRDSAVLGFSAKARIAEATEFFARYDGEVGGGTENHVFTAGVRMTW